MGQAASFAAPDPGSHVRIARSLSFQPAIKSATCELAMLASRSIHATIAVAEAEVEAPLSKVLSNTHDTSTQCWAMAILSNIASVPKSRERQAACVPALCQLLCSPIAEVQHAASLHLATLSHSEGLTNVIGSSRDAMSAIRDLEHGRSNTLASPAYASLRQEASQYARWALRTAQGRNYKPAYKPKSKKQLEEEASIQMQKRFRSSLMAAAYRRELRARKAAATVMQAGYRGHVERAAIAQQMLREAPAAAALQALVRGKRHRAQAKLAEEAAAAAREQAAADESASQELAATRMQARVRGSNARSGGDGGYRKVHKTFALSAACAEGESVVLELKLAGAYDFVGGGGGAAGGGEAGDAEAEKDAAAAMLQGAAREAAEAGGRSEVTLAINVADDGAATISIMP